MDTKLEAKEIKITFQYGIKNQEFKGVVCVHSILGWLIFGSAVNER
jgi:hypothetical protein